MPSSSDRPSATDRDPVAEGLALLDAMALGERSVARALDVVELVTSAPDRQREILDLAVERGIVERDGPVVRATGSVPERFEEVVVRKEGEFDCRRCGATIRTGCFVRGEGVDVGPFGSTCIRTVLGRD